MLQCYTRTKTPQLNRLSAVSTCTVSAVITLAPAQGRQAMNAKAWHVPLRLPTCLLCTPLLSLTTYLLICSLDVTVPLLPKLPNKQSAWLMMTRICRPWQSCKEGCWSRLALLAGYVGGLFIVLCISLLDQCRRAIGVPLVCKLAPKIVAVYTCRCSSKSA